MRFFIAIGVIASCLFATSLSAPVDCDGAVPQAVCDHLKRVERRLGHCVHRASSLITAAVENAAKKNAVLFAKTVQLLRNSTSAKRPMNASELAALLQDMEETFDKVEAARDTASTAALKSIEEASLRVASLMEKLIAAAADEDRSDMEKCQAKLKKAVKNTHIKVREAAFKAISQVHKGNVKVERYVVHLLKKLGLSQAQSLQSFVDALSQAENAKLADETEAAIEADFDAVANEAFELMAESDNAVSKRFNMNDVLSYIKAKLSAAIQVVTAAVKAAIAKALPLIRQKIGEIVQIVISAAKEAIINIAGEFILVTAAPTL
eukprot:Seg1179.1 transcript_id=Seg1179.1/GoldUCD/mRNA.D3Y31 product="hypothetical protein" protein_id=Seg1179.1/GoldUCD/D3Y31